MMKKYLLLDPRYIAYRPAMELPADSELGVSVFTHVVDAAKAISKYVRDAFVRSASIKALSALDDRLLRDIGIDRYTLAATVDEMMKSGAPVALRPLATVYPIAAAETTKDEVTLRPAA